MKFNVTYVPIYLIYYVSWTIT